MKPRACIIALLFATSLALAGPTEWKPGDKLKDTQHTYELVRHLGTGGYVQAWQARTESGETVAVRIYMAGASRMFESNLRAVSALQTDQQTPHLLRVSPISTDFIPGVGEIQFHVAEQADRDIASVLERDFMLGPDVRDGNQRVRRLHDLMLALLSGIRQLHNAEMVHGDIKPENILVVQDRYVLGDFDGMASPLNLGVGCTVEYCPPDLSQRVSREYDYWSVASTLFKAAIGRTPKELSLLPPHRAFQNLSEIEKVVFPDETEGVAMRAAALESLDGARPQNLNRAARKQYKEITAFVSAGLRVDTVQRRDEVEALLPLLLNPTPNVWKRCVTWVVRAASRARAGMTLRLRSLPLSR